MLIRPHAHCKSSGSPLRCSIYALDDFKVDFSLSEWLIPAPSYESYSGKKQWPQKLYTVLTWPNREAWCLKFDDIDCADFSLVRLQDTKTRLPLERKRQWANGWFNSQRDGGRGESEEEKECQSSQKEYESKRQRTNTDTIYSSPIRPWVAFF